MHPQLLFNMHTHTQCHTSSICMHTQLHMHTHSPRLKCKQPTPICIHTVPYAYTTLGTTPKPTHESLYGSINTAICRQHDCRQSLYSNDSIFIFYALVLIRKCFVLCVCACVCACVYVRACVCVCMYVCTTEFLNVCTRVAFLHPITTNVNESQKLINSTLIQWYLNAV